MRRLKLYTDGSYSDSNPAWTFGGMLVLDDKDQVLCVQRYKSSKRDFVAGRNVGGELIAAMCGIAVAAMMIKKSEPDGAGVIDIFYDYKGVEAFIQGNPKWKAQKESSATYVACINEIRKQNPNLKINFHKVRAHSGDMFNDMADRIAAGEIAQSLRDKVLQEVEF